MERYREIERCREIQTDVNRYRELQRDVERYRKVYRDIKRCREIQRDTVRYRMIQRHIQNCRAIQKDMRRQTDIHRDIKGYRAIEICRERMYGKIWIDIKSYGEIKRYRATWRDIDTENHASLLTFAQISMHPNMLQHLFQCFRGCFLKQLQILSFFV